MGGESRSIVYLYLKEISSFPLLSAEEEKELGRRVQAGDQEAFTRLVESNLRFVVKVAKKYARRNGQLLDLIHEGNLGLMEAARRFDPGKNVRFLSYAVWWIRQAIQVAAMDLQHPMRLPYRIGNALRQVGAAITGQFMELKRKPHLDEVAERVGLSRTELTSLLQTTGTALSINQPPNEDGSAPSNYLEQSCIPSPQDELQERINRVSLSHAMGKIEKRAEKILTLRFGLEDGNPLTLKEIGDRMGLSRERIRQIELKALHHLRQNWREVSLRQI